MAVKRAINCKHEQQQQHPFFGWLKAKVLGAWDLLQQESGVLLYSYKYQIFYKLSNIWIKVSHLM